MKKILLTLFTFCQLLLTLPGNVFSQAPQSWTSSDMYLALRKLNVLGSVLYVAAHPDDENTRLITYFSKDKLYRTGYLSLTRGDGGQNLIGDEQGVELGLIRTQELLAARRIDGGEQFFSRAYDFGYSKNPEETFSKWDKEKILSDVVWVIRKFQPDVIITRFPTTGEGGHGHHTGSAILANEAFTVAADPKRFPEQLKYVQPWQPKRILWNTFNFGGTNTITPDQFRVDVGGYNPLLGRSYGEIAAESRSQHKSQGFGVPSSRGESFESFKTMGGTEPKNDLMDDVDLSWKKVRGSAGIEGKINDLISSFDLLHPEKSVEGLVALYKAISNLPEGYWKTQKLEEVKELIVQCSGLFLDVTTTEQFAVQTDSIKINFSFNNRSGTDAVLQKVVVGDFDSVLIKKMESNKNVNFSKTLFVSSQSSITQPYWLKEKMEEGFFNVAEIQKIGQPDIDAAYQVNILVNIKGQDFNFTRPLKYKFTDPVKGELYQPVFIIPAATVMSSPSLVLFKNNEWQEKEVQVQLNANKALPGNTRFFLRTADSLLSLADTTAYNKFQSRRVSFYLNNSSLISSIKDGKRSLKRIDSLSKKEKLTTRRKKEMEKFFSVSGSNDIVYPYVEQGDSAGYYLSVRAINHDHIPSIKYFFPDAIKSLVIDLKTDGKKVGYIIGAGDKVPEALEQMGYEVTLLTDKELARNNLKQFDAIISGIRAHNTNEWLNKYYDKLMKYVNEGGNYIVQYNTSNFVSSVKNKVGPYDFTFSRTRVTDENATVNFLKPGHPVLNVPNKITPGDFKGWVQERSVYHASNWDKNFESIFSMSDPGEKPDEGSLIIAQYGKGFFTYTGLVFFRELPAGVPGAYRLLANLIALNKKKAF
ncbi:MAG: PIG-L family deacetylase [Chitinophagaceae bacterium]